MDWKLKLLSGSVAGAEYPLAQGDTVFVVGLQQHLWDGTAGGYAAADNVVFIPDECAEVVFVVRVVAPDDLVADAPPLQIALARNDGEALQFETLPVQTPHAVGPLWLAACDQIMPWAPRVREFVVPKRALVTVEKTGRKASRHLLAAAVLVTVLAVGAVWHFMGLNRDPGVVGVAAIEARLHGGPETFTVLAGRDRRLYVFTRDPENVLWAKRALQGISQEAQTVFVTTQSEVERVGRLLEPAGQGAAIIRLGKPQRPEVHVVARDRSAPESAGSTRALLMDAMPYAQDVLVKVMDESALAQTAQAELGALGITSRVVSVANHVSVLNDVVLADADLASMLSYRKRFTEQWGERWVSIRIELWDDLTKGQSYEYGPQQLLTTEQGRWKFLRPVSTEPSLQKK